MKHFTAFGMFFLLATFTLCAQESETEQLRKQLKEATEKFQKAIDENRQIVESLKKKIEALESKTNAPATAAPVLTNAPPLETARTNTEPASGWSPGQPIRIGGGQNYINLSFDGLVAAGTSTANDVDKLQLGGHDPNQRGFTVQNLETTFEGKVDPYFRAQANIVLQIDHHGETDIEAEEAYAETMSLPLNLQARAGMFITEFGRINPTHPHTWDFADAPIIHARLLGEDGLRNPGLRVSWLTPTPFYSELFLTVQNAQGSSAHSFDDHDGSVFLGRTNTQRGIRSAGDLLFTPRYVVSFDLTPSQTILAGASAALGPNSSGEHANTQIYGLDIFYKWKPVDHHAGFPFVSWQTEGMVRRYEAAEGLFAVDTNGDGVPEDVPLPHETLLDYGFYSQVAYGFRKGWVTAFRGDFVTSPKADYEKAFSRDPDRATRWRLSPNLTYYPTEFSKIRLQYNYDHRADVGIDHSVWMQFEFLIGSHGAHKF